MSPLDWLATDIPSARWMREHPDQSSAHRKRIAKHAQKSEHAFRRLVEAQGTLERARGASGERAPAKQVAHAERTVRQCERDLTREQTALDRLRALAAELPGSGALTKPARGAAVSAVRAVCADAE